MIPGIRAEVRVVLPLERVRPALLDLGWPWLGGPGLEATREIELSGNMRRLKLVLLGITALPDELIAQVEVHRIAVLRTSQLKGEIRFQSNRSTTNAVFTGSAAAESFDIDSRRDARGPAFDLATAVLKNIVHDLELSQLAGVPSARPASGPRR